MGHGGSRNLSDAEIDQLVAFILQIDGNEPAATPRVCGDENGDRLLDILDVIMNLQFASGVSLADTVQRVLGDLNRDGIQTHPDAAKTLQYVISTNSSNLNECGLP